MVGIGHGDLGRHVYQLLFYTIKGSYIDYVIADRGVVSTKERRVVVVGQLNKDAIRSSQQIYSSLLLHFTFLTNLTTFSLSFSLRQMRRMGLTRQEMAPA